MFDYEYGKADYNLDEIKEKLLVYLKKSHFNSTDPETEAFHTFKYLENIVDRIVKRKDINIKFNGGGSPSWHATVLLYLSRWVAAEVKTSELLSQELDSQLND